MAEGRLTMAVEWRFWQAVAEAAMLGQDVGLLKGVVDGLRSGKPLDDDFAGRMMALAPKGPWGEWADLIRGVVELADMYAQLKRLHGPQEFRALLSILLEVECFLPILDEAERHALGVKGGERVEQACAVAAGCGA